MLQIYCETHSNIFLWCDACMYESKVSRFLSFMCLYVDFSTTAPCLKYVSLACPSVPLILYALRGLFSLIFLASFVPFLIPNTV